MRIFKIVVLLIFCTNLFGQDIKGVVLDSITKEPLVYANVILQTQQIGVATNYKGVFQINNKNNLENDTLVVSHVGYKPKK